MSLVLYILRSVCAALPATLALALALLAVAEAPAEAPSNTTPLLSYQRPAEPTRLAVAPQATQTDRAVRAAGFDATQKAEAEDHAVLNDQIPTDARQLAPESRVVDSRSVEGNSATLPDPLPFALPQIESLTTAGTGLAIVVGLFLVCIWLLRQSGPKPTTPLPKEAIAVLGRVPLAARSFAHLIQVGNKLVLVAVTPDGVAPLTEVTEPTEVDRLLGMCLRNRKHSTTAEFQQVLQQLANEPAKGFLGNEASTMAAAARR